MHVAVQSSTGKVVYGSGVLQIVLFLPFSQWVASDSSSSLQKGRLASENEVVLLLAY